MNEMVERLARAICVSVGRDPDAPFKTNAGRDADFPEWHRWAAEARAAFAAIRRPTEGQRRAYYRLSYYTEAMSDAAWERAIDACLEAD